MCVHDDSYACILYIHTGVGHTDNESAQHFDSDKLAHIFLVLRTGFKPLYLDLESMLYQLSHPFTTRRRVFVMASIICQRETVNLFC